MLARYCCVFPIDRLASEWEMDGDEGTVPTLRVGSLATY